MARVKKAATKKRAVKKTAARRGRPSAKNVAAKLDPTKNAIFKSAVTRREKAAAALERLKLLLKRPLMHWPLPAPRPKPPRLRLQRMP